MVCTAEKYCYGDQIKKNVIGVVHGTHGRQKSSIKSFRGNTWRNETTFKTPAYWCG